MALFGVLRKLERAAAAVADGEIDLMEGVAAIFTLLKFALERAVAHFFDEIIRTRSELYLRPQFGTVSGYGQKESRRSSDHRRQTRLHKIVTHNNLLLVAERK